MISVGKSGGIVFFFCNYCFLCNTKKKRNETFILKGNSFDDDKDDDYSLQRKTIHHKQSFFMWTSVCTNSYNKKKSLHEELQENDPH